MKVNFVKMHGLGNDFILIDCIGGKIVSLEQPDTIKRLCSRRGGIGADQMLLIFPSSAGDYKMKIFNADGQEVEMCGNGIRCLAKYLNNIDPSKGEFEIETLAGIIRPKIKDCGQVEVDMGMPVLEGSRIPIELDNINFNITRVSMGNPHCVIFCNDVDNVPLESYGPLLENHSMFPNKTNVEFVEVKDRYNIRMRVWERGAGITLACGTGACASVVASVCNDKTDKNVKVALDGGTLDINWNEDNHVYMTGPAEKVFVGEVDVPIVN